MAQVKEEQEEVLERLRGVQEALEKELGHSESLAEALTTKEEEMMACFSWLFGPFLGHAKVDSLEFSHI